LASAAAACAVPHHSASRAIAAAHLLSGLLHRKKSSLSAVPLM